MPHSARCNVWEWVEDSWHANYDGAPTGGSAWLRRDDPSYPVVRGGFGELGPFVEKINLMAWLEVMVLRLGPSAVMYANQFPDADPNLIWFFQEFGTELVQGFKR
jgi:hypothetical protein